MSDTLATYTFLPWLRQGLANEISGQSGSRATIPIDLVIKGDRVDGNGQETLTINKNIEIYGPGDITGLDPKSIIKVEPRNWITNFEPNYLPYIEFYDEDLPWRYSPAPNPAQHRLQPWLALVVLREDEFEDGRNIKDKPLPFIKLNSMAKLPDHDQLWAWAHVHVNRSLIDSGFRSTDTGSIATKLENLLRQNPDLAYSRIICPRKLEGEVAYHAFLVPSYETGRQAGLGENPEGTAWNAPAWEAGAIPDGHLLPYYHRWFFKTGTVGDFEYLVRLLEPKPVNSKVGTRDMDVQQPGANLQGLRDAPATPDEQKLHGILKLEGALKLPDVYYDDDEFEEVEKYRNWPTLNGATEYPHPFQENIAGFINLTDSYEAESAQTANANADLEQEVDAADPSTEYDIKNNPDPLITAPLYGRWHSLHQRLLHARDNTTPLSPDDNWVHDLNLDPRWRVAAGFGTKIVQENQEEYMKAAWEQIGDVLEANRKIKEAQLAKAISNIWYQFHLKPIREKSRGKWLSFSAPVHKRILSEAALVDDPEVTTLKTVFFQKKQSRLTLAPTSVNFRKVIRPRGKLVKRLPFNNEITPFNIIDRINDGEVTAAPPKETPEGTQKPEDLLDGLEPNVPDIFLDLLDKYPWIKYIPLILILLIILLMILFWPWSTVATGAAVAAIGFLLYLYRLLDRWEKEVNSGDVILEENQTPESVDEIPNSPDFVISLPADGFTPTLGGDQDSEEAAKFKQALLDVNVLLKESADLGRPIVRLPLNIPVVSDAVFTGVAPALTIPRWVFASIQLPPFIMVAMIEQFVPAMAYPKFEIPMYKPLVKKGAELFLPNINFIDQNSISILETNQKFIESYMVGLNHEFARELLWREYPTDQRGSYFRQFWEVSGFADFQPVNLEAIKARYKKILDDRFMPELEEYYNRLVNDPGSVDEEFLDEAHQEILKEELKDIKPIHYWSRFSDLGDHDNREEEGDNEEEVVLVIRGELLKKYPTAVIYAHKAVWRDEDGEPVLNEEQVIDPKQERTLAPIPAGQEKNPPKSIVKSPLYEAKVDPDIYFFGFDLTVCEAKGGTGRESDPVDERCEDTVQWDDAGWFFVIKERPGEPRFGLDIGNGNPTPADDLQVWNDLSWDDVELGNDDTMLDIDGIGVEKVLTEPTDTEDIEKKDQWEEDKVFTYNQDMNAAELAYILYQVPVLVAVHGSEMLPNV